MEVKLTLKLSVKWERDGGEFFIHDIWVKNGPSILESLPKVIIEHITTLLEEDHLSEPTLSGISDYDIDDIKVEVDYRLSKGTDPKFSSSFGNWLPGDPEELNITGVSIGGVDILKSLPQSTIDRIETKVYDYAQAHESIDVSKRYRDAINKVEKKLYSKLQRGKIKSKLGKKGKSKIPGFGYWFKRN